ncbi:ABC transporter permease [Paenibacillus athensensis]|nr:ABC transporter permease [Paenibacillus athensensis]MCD1259428.1 ABC transporter permease [Paenibacillus athensensis]
MNAFSRLIKTELRNRRTSIVVTLAAMLLIHAAILLLLASVDFPDEAMSFILSLDVAVFVLFLLPPLLHSFTTWKEEWKQQAIYQLLTLPVPRSYLLLSKYVSLLLETLLLSGVMVAGLSLQNLVNGGLLFRAEPLYAWNVSKFVFMGELVLFATSLIFLSFVSLLLGTTVRRFSHTLSFAVFVVGLLVVIVSLSNLPPLLTLIGLCLLFYGASLYVLDKKVGVH